MNTVIARREVGWGEEEREERGGKGRERGEGAGMRNTVRSRDPLRGVRRNSGEKGRGHEAWKIFAVIARNTTNLQEHGILSLLLLRATQAYPRPLPYLEPLPHIAQASGSGPYCVESSYVGWRVTMTPVRKSQVLTYESLGSNDDQAL